MAENLEKLANALFVDNKPILSGDLLQKLRSDDSIRLGLEQFYLILKHGVKTVGDGKLQLESWNDLQIQAVCSIAYGIAFVSRSLSVEQAEPIIVAVIQQSIEFVLCYLEKSKFNEDDLGIQNNMVHFLEITLVDEMDKASELLESFSISSLVDLLPVVAGFCGSHDHIKCHLEGFSCSKEEKRMDRLLMTLASECMLSDRLETEFSTHNSHQDFSKLVFLSQHLVVSHGGSIPRLFMLCNELIQHKDLSDEKIVSVNFRKRLSFTLRILKLLGSLTKDAPYVEHDASLMSAVASFADVIPSLFRLGFEFVNSHASVEGSLETIILMVLEEFLQNIQVIFCNSSVPKNIQACIIASILDSLDISVWRYDKCAPNSKPPLAYFPRSVLYMLKLIRDIKRRSHQVLDWKGFHEDVARTSADLPSDSPSCHVRLQTVPLLKRYTFEDLLKLIFPSSKQWIDNLVHLAFFLHCEGLKLRPKVERSYSSSAKFSCTTEVENPSSHEDEALFGDLFSESGRSVGSNDGCDQPLAAAVSSSTSCCNMPIQAASEVLSFLKMCIFSPEWDYSIFEDGCKKLVGEHIDIMLCLISCEGCCSEDIMSDSCAPIQEDRKTGHIHELCFDLLHTLLMHHALSNSLEDHLVEKILNVENGAFTYNNRTLTLLAHTLFLRAGSTGSQLRTKIYTGYVAFIVEKARSVCSNFLSIKELLGTLPLLFHIEILLMAFHLSSEGEKKMFANLIFTTLKEIDTPYMDFNCKQLSSWALVVSRLILVLRHMIFHQHTCPSSLLLDVRSKLREAPRSRSFLPNNVTDQWSSWTLTAVKDLMGGDDMAIDRLTLSWDDIYGTFSWILGFWKGKKALTVEDLIVERYIFILCWDIPSLDTVSDHVFPLWSDPQNVDTSTMLYFFYSSHSFLGHHEAIGKYAGFPDFVVGLLQHLSDSHLSEDIEELGWGFLRNGLWLSLVLSVTNAGIWGSRTENAVLGPGQFWTENTSGDRNYVNIARGLFPSVIEAGQVALLVKLLSTLLDRYVQIYQKAFLATFCNKQNRATEFSPLLLLKHSGIDKFLQDELLERNGTNSSELESVLSIVSKLDATVDKKASGIVSRASWECMIHGFPFNLSTHSATVLSCILCIRGIISILDVLLGLKDVVGNFALEADVLQQIFDTVMTIKYDRIFESIQGKCETIYLSLSAELEGSDYYGNLILMKHMECFLREINARGVSDSSVHEWLITKVIDTLGSLRKDPSKSVMFQFYLGVEDVTNQINKLFRLHRGDLLVLIDSLDTCYSESVNVKVLGFFVDILSGDQSPDLRQKIKRKFLDMDLLRLSKWLENRLLGCVMDSSDGINCEKGSSASLRESTVNFILCLLSSSPENSK
ncbi:Auxin transport protein BIG [Quillaja saponaria]|uniref:Auxin transport protein BIG n=1 Tax=Quillaja saponaria TaxID=32244 RepID=A0AAD7VG44_QUISA|nr:Auxin transport protein BIG [Quillaja saponaria]